MLLWISVCIGLPFLCFNSTLDKTMYTDYWTMCSTFYGYFIREVSAYTVYNSVRFPPTSFWAHKSTVLMINKGWLSNNMEKRMATHSSTLAWKIPWTEGPGGLQSMGSLGVGHDWMTSLYFSLSCIGEGNGNTLQCSCLENPRDRGAWWAAVYGVAHSRTRLNWLSSSSMKTVWKDAKWINWNVKLYL